MSNFERIALVSLGVLLLVVGGAITALGGVDLMASNSRAQLSSDAPVFVGSIIAAIGIAAILAGALDLPARLFMFWMLLFVVAVPPVSLLLVFGSVAPSLDDRVVRCKHRYTNELTDAEGYRHGQVTRGCEQLRGQLGWNGRAPGGLKGVLAARSSD